MKLSPWRSHSIILSAPLFNVADRQPTWREALPRYPLWWPLAGMPKPSEKKEWLQVAEAFETSRLTQKAPHVSASLGPSLAVERIQRN